MTVSYDGMFLGVSQELKLFAMSLMAGGVLGAVYDILRAARLSIKHSFTLVAIEDALFIIAFGMTYYSFCVAMLEGAMRMFALVGFIAGFAVYLCTLGRLVCGILSTALSTLSKMLMLLVKTLKKPLMYLCGLPFLRNIKKKFSKTACHD